VIEITNDPGRQILDLFNACDYSRQINDLQSFSVLAFSSGLSAKGEKAGAIALPIFCYPNIRSYLFYLVLSVFTWEQSYYWR